MQAILSKAKPIRLLALDVDGVLTNGILYYGNENLEIKGFHIHDGLGIKLLQKINIQVAIISAKQSAAVLKRITDLNISHFYLGYEDKLPAYEDLKKKLQLTDNEIAYIGDDLPDLPLLKRVGFAITVPNAPDIIKQQVDYITAKKPGKGAVREVCELILQAQNQTQQIINFYLER